MRNINAGMISKTESWTVPTVSQYPGNVTERI